MRQILQDDSLTQEQKNEKLMEVANMMQSGLDI
jgi:hypothetical protein